MIVRRRLSALFAVLPVMLAGGLAIAQTGTAPTTAKDPRSPEGKRYRAQPLVTKIYAADPSAHVFNGKIYVYPSHDVDAKIPDDDLGNQYAMHDYQVLSMDRPGGPVTIHPVGIDVAQIPWASKQTWAPDAAYKNGTYYLYMPARDKQGVFRIGVATSNRRPARSRPSPNRSAAAFRSTPPSSPTATARATCISAASGAVSFSAGQRDASIRMQAIPT